MSNLLPAMLVAGSDTARIDSYCQNHDLAPATLMEAAGRLVAQFVEDLASKQTCPEIFVILGTGNNAGDGLVAARHLFSRFDVRLFEIETSQKPSSLYEKQRSLCLELGLKFSSWRAGQAWPRSENGIFLDAIFGSGFKPDRPLNETLHQALSFLYQETSPVVAIDLPSGLSPDGPHEESVVIPLGAQRYTLALDTLKYAHVSEQASSVVGVVKLLDLGIPREWKERLCLQHFDAYLAPSTAAAWQGASADSYKHKKGHVLVVGGSSGREGAVALSSQAALRAGAGYVTIAMPEEARSRQQSAAWKGFYAQLKRSTLTYMIETAFQQQN